MESAVIRDSRSAVARGLISGPSQAEIKGIKLQYSIHVPTKHLRRELTFIFPGHLSQHEDMKIIPCFFKSDVDLISVTAQSDQRRDEFLQAVSRQRSSNHNVQVFDLSSSLREKLSSEYWMSFGGGGFSFGQPTSTQQQPTGQTSAPSLFGSQTGAPPAGQPRPTQGMFGATPAPAFGGFGAGSTAAQAPAATQAPSFGGFGSTSTTTATATPTPAFGGFGAGSTAAKAPAATPAPAFGGFGAGSTASSTSNTVTTSATSVAGATAFGGLGAAAKTTAALSSVGIYKRLNVAASTPASTAAPALGAGLPVATVQTNQTPGPLKLSDLTTPAKTVTASSNTDTSVAVDGSHLALKNKNMQDILNRWNHDLDNYTKEFHKLAVQVSVQDRQLLENGFNISKLFQEIKSVQDLSGEIDASLEYIESQQLELSKTLDSYEASLRETYESANNAALNPVDSEREYTYDLAENLNRQLDEMGEQLNSIVQELGNSQPKSEDELDMVVNILGQHLSSIQWLDSNIGAMTSSVSNLEKQSDTLRSR
ncbi:MAG: hypothetical protein SGCHY_003545 [Lobulomycetales sp.]